MDGVFMDGVFMDGVFMTGPGDAGSPAVPGPFPGHGTRPYRAYVLGALLVVYTFNFIDRVLVGVLNEPIKNAFNLSDAQMGWLGGPAFAILYTFLGIPIARLAERFNRVTIISVAVAVWSGMTAVCGLAGNYWQLLLARIGVSVGEAGCSPPAHSLISDYFPLNRRASALSIYALGIPLGSLFAAVAGGYIAEEIGWRQAFLLLGLPGVVIAVIFKLTVREPPRYSAAEAPKETVTFGEALRTMAAKRSFLFIAMGGALTSFVGYGIGQFLSSFFIRTHELSLTEAGLIFGVLAGVASAIGTLAGGWIADRIGDRDKRWFCWISAAGVAVAAPIYALGLSVESLSLAVVLIAVPSVLNSLWLGPTFATTQNLAPPHMRATASALLLFLLNIIGYGGGPVAVGYLSDFLIGINFGDAAGGLTYVQACTGAAAAEFGEICASARAAGLQQSLTLTVFFGYMTAALMFWLASLTLTRDLDPSSRT